MLMFTIQKTIEKFYFNLIWSLNFSSAPVEMFSREFLWTLQVFCFDVKINCTKLFGSACEKIISLLSISEPKNGNVEIKQNKNAQLSFNFTWPLFAIDVCCQTEEGEKLFNPSTFHVPRLHEFRRKLRHIGTVF